MRSITPFPWFDDNVEEAARVHEAMLGMQKLDLPALRAADDG
jgi:hypothetical protein